MTGLANQEAGHWRRTACRAGPAGCEPAPHAEPSVPLLGSRYFEPEAPLFKASGRSSSIPYRGVASVPKIGIQTFPQPSRSRPRGCADLLAQLMLTHETYLQQLVAATLRGEVTSLHFAQKLEDVIVNCVQYYVELRRSSGKRWRLHRLDLP